MVKTMKIPVALFMTLCGLAGWGLSDIVIHILKLVM